MHRQKAGIMRLRGGKRREGCSFSQDNYPLFWYWFRCKHCICSQKICYFAMLNCAIRLPGNVFWICICGRGGKCRRGGGDAEQGSPGLLLLNVHHHCCLPSPAPPPPPTSPQCPPPPLPAFSSTNLLLCCYHPPFTSALKALYPQMILFQCPIRHSRSMHSHKNDTM